MCCYFTVTDVWGQPLDICVMLPLQMSGGQPLDICVALSLQISGGQPLDICVMLLLQMSGGQPLADGAHNDGCSSDFVEAVRGLGKFYSQ